MRKVEAAVRAQPRVRAAQEAVQAARERRETVAGEVEALEGDLDSLEARIEAVTDAGDPGGEIRDLSGQRRELRDKLEDAGADLAAQEAAVRGAVRSESRAILDAMGDVWAALDVDGPEERVLEALDALASALEELDALKDQYKALRDWARHLVSHVLDGEGQTPTMEEPSAGLAPVDLAALSRVVRGVRATLEVAEPELEEVMA